MNRAVMSLFLVAALLAPACKKDKKKPADKPADKPAVAADAGAGAGAEKPAGDPALVERGKYLADLMGCQHCHTPFGPNGPDLDKAWAGGLEIPEKFGTWRSPNISMDKDTGIGGWTDQQIIDAIREGKRPTGDGLFPIMPYLFYNAMSNDDARALVAFMRTVPAISNKVERATDLKIPKIPAPPPTGQAPDKADPVAHGGYLVSLMHCGACHTPMKKDGSPDMAKMFAGGFPMELPMMGEGVLYSSNITPDEKTGIGAWSEEDVTRAIREMKKKDGTPILPPMALYQTGWYRIEDGDMKAIAAFLKTGIKPIANAVPKSTFKPKAPGGAPPPAAAGAPEKGATPDKGAAPAEKPATP